MSRLPDSLKKVLSAAKIHAITLVEIGLGLSGDDRGQVIDNVWSIRHEGFRNTGVRDIGREGNDLERSSGRSSGFDRIGHRQSVHRSASDVPPFCKSLAKFTADHSSCAGYQDFHSSPIGLNDE